MKLNVTISILLIIITTLLSCSKKSAEASFGTSSTPPTITDTLTGKEFTFSDLTWNYWIDNYNELHISIQNRPDLFTLDRIDELFVKSVSDTAWIKAEKTNPYLSVGYNYFIYVRGLYVFPYPYIQPWSANNQLAGTKASIKFRFR